MERTPKPKLVRQPKLKGGDYCHEQHELIVVLAEYLSDLAGTQDAEQIAFLQAACLGVLREYKLYSTDYKAWLAGKRQAG